MQPVRTISAPDEIEIGHLPNTNQKRYRLNIPAWEYGQEPSR
jgi:hypothetical protein